MAKAGAISRNIKAIKWVARIWSVLLFLMAVLMVIAPDPHTVEPVKLQEMIVLGFYGVSVLGLMLAWRWELPGGIAAAGGVMGHLVGFRIVEGYWMAQFLIMPGLFILIPAALHLLSWYLTNNPRTDDFTTGGNNP